MRQETNLALVAPLRDRCNMGGLVLLICMVVSWIFIHRWGQRNKKGPKTWPFLGAAIEQLMNYDRMHDWLVHYLSKSKTVVVPMPFTTYTYIADPVNVEHVLKTNFNNYPKVIYFSLQGSLLIFNARPYRTDFDVGSCLVLMLLIKKKKLVILNAG